MVNNTDLYRVIKVNNAMTLATEVPFDFDFKYTPSQPGSRDYPGDGAEVEIVKVTLNGVQIPLAAITPEMEQQMIEQVLDHYY